MFLAIKHGFREGEGLIKAFPPEGELYHFSEQTWPAGCARQLSDFLPRERGEEGGKGGEHEKGVHENKRDPREWDFAGTPFPSHERAKLVLFYNPSATATRRGGPGSSSSGGYTIEGRERKGDGGILQDGWTGGVATGVERLSTSVLKVCDSLQIDSLSSF